MTGGHPSKSRGSPRRGDERGSGSVLVLGLTGVVLSALLAVLLLGSAAIARHRAAVAADLAALAAADVLLGRAAGDACGRAELVALAQGARLRACAVGSGSTADVVVSVAPTAAGTLLGTATARARAGPHPRDVVP